MWQLNENVTSDKKNLHLLEQIPNAKNDKISKLVT